MRTYALPGKLGGTGLGVAATNKPEFLEHRGLLESFGLTGWLTSLGLLRPAPPVSQLAPEPPLVIRSTGPVNYPLLKLALQAQQGLAGQGSEMHQRLVAQSAEEHRRAFGMPHPTHEGKISPYTDPARGQVWIAKCWTCNWAAWEQSPDGADVRLIRHLTGRRD